MPNIPIRKLIDLLGEEGAAKELGVPEKVCANDRCGKTFLWHKYEDGSIAEKMPHTSGGKFCNPVCARDQKKRDYRGRFYAYRDEVRRVAAAYGFKPPLTKEIREPWKNGIDVKTLERRILLHRAKKQLEKIMGVPLDPEDLAQMADE